jgi:hypothetical protein
LFIVLFESIFFFLRNFRFSHFIHLLFNVFCLPVLIAGM